MALVNSDWTSAIGQEDHCPNCGEDRSGPFCGRCGQRQLEGRMAFRSMLGDLFSRVVNLEKGLFFTFWRMMVSPGQVAKDYVTGKQRAYVNPLGYFFLGTALQMVALYLAQPIFAPQLREKFDLAIRGTNPDAYEKVNRFFGGDGAGALVECYLSAMQQGYAYAALLFFCLPFGVWLYLLQRTRSGERFRLGETMVFSLYCFGQMLIITAILTPICIRINSTLQMVSAMGTYLIYPHVAHRQFFESTWRARFGTAFATIASCASFVVSILMIFFASIAITVYMKKNGMG